MVIEMSQPPFEGWRDRCINDMVRKHNPRCLDDQCLQIKRTAHSIDSGRKILMNPLCCNFIFQTKFRQRLPSWKNEGCCKTDFCSFSLKFPSFFYDTFLCLSLSESSCFVDASDPRISPSSGKNITKLLIYRWHHWSYYFSTSCVHRTFFNWFFLYFPAFPLLITGKYVHTFIFYLPYLLTIHLAKLITDKYACVHICDLIHLSYYLF